MSNEEKELQTWEVLPSRSGEAFVAARDRALASGQSVLQSAAGVIYQVSPSGASHEVMRIDPPLQVEKGKIIILK